MTQPNNRSGKHKNPRRVIPAPNGQGSRKMGAAPDFWRAVDQAALDDGVKWGAWVGGRLIEALAKRSQKRLKPGKSTHGA